MPKYSSLKIIPLGGVSEIGKNIMVLEKDNKAIIIDCGIMFPDENMPGIDFVIPDFSYIKKNIKKMMAIVITHGHEDHIGALPFLFKDVKLPIFGTKLTLGLVKSKLNNSLLENGKLLNEIDPSKRLKLGPFDMEFFRVNHSIPDGVGIIIRTDIGTLVHSGDFKFDHNPVDGKSTEFAKISKAGGEGVLGLFCDSTNSEEIGYTRPERDVGKTLTDKFVIAPKRIIVATFSSHIHRIQQVFDVASGLGKKVAISGKSILKNIKIASELGYLTVPEEAIIPITKIDDIPLSKLVILSTGTQGEPLSALRKMALGEHKRIQIMQGDMVFISASPIPGNESAISSTINMLLKRGADVFYESIAGVHVSGHAAREEIKLMIDLVRPKYFIPIHGERKHKTQNAKLAIEMGVEEKNILMIQNGDTIKCNKDMMRITSNIQPRTIYIDGVGSGDIEDMVLKDRRALSRSGIIFVTLGLDREKMRLVDEPSFSMKGIIYIDNFDSVKQQLKELVEESVLSSIESKITNSTIIEKYINDKLEKFIFKNLRIKPIIITKIIDF